MGFFAQLALLLWKNFILMWRSKFWLFFELIFTFLLMPYIIIALKYDYVTKKESYSFIPLNITGNSSDIYRRPLNSQRINQYYNCPRHEVNVINLGYSFEEGLSGPVVKLMDKVRNRYPDNYSHSAEDVEIDIHIQKFDSLKEMNEFLEEDLGQTRYERCGEYIGGVHFTKSSMGSQPELVYRIMLPKRGRDFDDYGDSLLQQFWLHGEPNSPQSDLNQIPSEPPYWPTGFLSFQYAIEASFLELNDENNGGGKLLPSMFNVSFLRIPIDEHKEGFVLMFMKAVYVLWLISLFVIILHTTKNIILEKEAGVKTYMSVMGLNPMAFYASHIIIGFIKAAILMVVCTAVFATTLIYVSSTVFVLFAVLFALTMITLAALIASIVKSPQCSQFMAILVPIILLALAVFMTPSTSQIGICLLASLNPVIAFRLGTIQIANSEAKMADLGWLNLFSGSATQFSLGLALLMLLVDWLLILCLLYYLDAVLPTDDSPKRHPLFFLKPCLNILCRKSKLAGKTVADEDQTDAMNENMEAEHGSLDEADIIIRHMSKKWSSGGILAVDNLNFRAYRGQLTVLLGHNGAGKTTTFSVLTGSINSTAGEVLICQKALETDLSECQKKIGYCPQNNPLFDKLNVIEHLKLYAGLKSGRFYGPNGKAELAQEIAVTLEQVGLSPQAEIQARQLSGGQKRKLCVAIALIGGSQVVLLDEPTAGMDPGARAQVGKLLAEVKKDRTILLTTHYMEEADALGDRIGIMVNGRLVCNGSSEFLKNKFSTGFILSVVCAGFTELSTSSDNQRQFHRQIERVLSVIRKYSPNARVEKAQRPPQFTVILPIADKRHYANLFQELEEGKILLGIKSFGLSLNTLEQVFLRVGELAEPDGDGGVDQVDGANKLAEDMFGVRQQQQLTTFCSRTCLCFRQFVALVLRHFLWTIRNPMRSVFPLFMALCCFIALGFIFKPSSPVLRESRELSLDTAHEYMRLPVQVKNEAKEAIARLKKQYLTISELICSAQSCVLKIDPGKDLHDELKKQLRTLPHMVAGIAIHENSNLTGQLEIEVLFDGIAIHSPPMALSFLMNAMLGANKFAIRPSIEIYDVPHNLTDDHHYEEKANQILRNFVIAAIVIMCFSIFAAGAVVPLVEDNSGKFKHQLLLTKVHVLTYWLSVIAWNLFFYLLYCELIAVSIYFFGWMNAMADMWLLWALYFWVYLPFNAICSFIFDKPQRAFTAVLIWGLVSSNMFLGITMILRFVTTQSWIPDMFDTIFFMITPAYALGSGVIQILIYSIHGPTPGEQWYLAKHAYLMTISGGVLWALVAIIQSRVVATKFHKLSCQLFHRNLYNRIQNQEWDENGSGGPVEDEEVRRERERLERQEETEFALAVRNLTKFYGQVPAVQNLTFGVKQKECFGLLGVNGAGKTTTFDILTGVRFATSGTATIGGVNVNKAPTIGYCPQFDALPMELTGREVLNLMLRLNGFSDVKRRVSRILWCIRMEQEADRRIMHYSGGQRRRISIGVTLATRSSLIMLDEPTAGIDPKTRRQIWQLLQAIRQQGIAILLTSHSMDECEELCNKIAFMNRGAMIGIGTSQQLKSRFGNSYLLTIIVANPGEAVCQQLNQLVMDRFHAYPTADLPTSRTLHWEMPRRENVPWSVLYKEAQLIADSYPDSDLLPAESEQLPRIVDFSLTQNSLEQVFLRMSRIGAEAAAGMTPME